MGRITCVSRDTKQTYILVRMMEKACMHTVRLTYMYSWHTDRQTDKQTNWQRKRERERVCVREEERVRLASFFLRKHFRTNMNFLQCDVVLFSKFHFFQEFLLFPVLPPWYWRLWPVALRSRNSTSFFHIRGIPIVVLAAHLDPYFALCLSSSQKVFGKDDS